MESETGSAATFDYQDESIEVVRLPRAWRVTRGVRTVERRWLDEALNELFGHTHEVLRFQVEILDRLRL